MLYLSRNTNPKIFNNHTYETDFFIDACIAKIAISCITKLVAFLIYNLLRKWLSQKLRLKNQIFTLRYWLVLLKSFLWSQFCSGALYDFAWLMFSLEYFPFKFLETLSSTVIGNDFLRPVTVQIPASITWIPSENIYTWFWFGHLIKTYNLWVKS